MDENAVLFENSYTQSEKILSRFFKYTFFKSNFMMTADILLAALFVYCIVNTLQTGTANSYLIVPPLFAAYQFFLYKSTFRRSWQSVLRAGGGTPPQQTTKIDDSGVYVNVYGDKSSFSYERLKRLVVTKDLMLLYTDAKQAIILPTDKFTAGTAEGFIGYAAEKGIRVIRNKF